METINDAPIEAVKAAGGSKAVAPLLWPEMLIEPAQRKLLDCLNPERSHRLSPEQAFYILRLAKEAGRHDSMEFVCHFAGYSKPTPVQPDDERAQLQKLFIESVKAQKALLDQLERL